MRFLADAKAAGVDGLIIVDLPPEEDDELCIPANKAGMNFIRLATPTTDEALPAVLQNTSGFVYYVSITGITGAGSAQQDAVAAAVGRLKAFTDLPIAVGFGITTPEQVAEIGSRRRRCRGRFGHCPADRGQPRRTRQGQARAGRRCARFHPHLSQGVRAPHLSRYELAIRSRPSPYPAPRR